jgi:AcrR family transcriptional regulator
MRPSRLGSVRLRTERGTRQEGAATTRDMKTYTIAELVSLTDVPPATIHYYLRQGLLPQPKRMAANRFVYDERHVQAVRLIRMLRDRRGLPLPMIRRIMPELSRLEAEEAFRPEMWDRALAPRMSRRPTPSTRLLEAAKEAFAKRGYGEVNVDDICRAARIAKGSFYRHHRSKEELFVAVTESLADDVVGLFREAMDQAPIDLQHAGPLLAGFLEPRLPVFLELLARSIQGRQGYPESARRILGRLAGQIGQSVAAPGSPEERGMQVVGAAATIILTQMLAPPTLVPGRAKVRPNLRAVPAAPATS